MMLEASPVTAPAEHEDPDYIEANPPDPVDEPSRFFKIGEHEGKWLEYDERGVPTKDVKKKKPTKKQKDELEQQYLDAKKKHGEYCNSVREWKQRQLDAEAALEKTDRFRWCFRQVGLDKNSPIEESELVELLKLLGYVGISESELGVVRKEALKTANQEGKLDMDSLRIFVKETFPMLLLEERLRTNERCSSFEPTELYSPRTWRLKLGKDGKAGGTQERSASKESKRSADSKKSPRSKREKSNSPSPAPKDDKKEKKDKKDKKEEKGAESPRASKAAKSKKEKK